MRYRLKTLRQDGSIAEIEIEAADAEAAREISRRQGHRALSVARAIGFSFGRSEKPRAFSLLIFSQELLALLEAGLGLTESLTALANKEGRQASRGMLQEILAALHCGEPFSAALARYPGQFPPIYIAAIQASECTSNLREALSRYITYAEQYDGAKNKIVSALVYPAIVLVVGLLVILFLLFYVVPRFSRVYEGFQGDLPLFSSILLWIGQAIDQHSFLIGSAGMVVVVASVWALRDETVRRRIGTAVLDLRVLGEKVRLFQLSRLYRTIGMLLRGGIPMLRAGEMVEPLLDPAARARLRTALNLIREGRSISDAMEAAGLTTPVGLSLLVVGERSGQMGETMERIAAFHDEEITRWTDRLIRLFEPILMAVLGLVVGIVVVLMYMPIFELAGVVQ